MRDATSTMTEAEIQREAMALKECLNYLQPLAQRAGMALCAHLVSLAAEAAEDVLRPKRDGGDGEAPKRPNGERILGPNESRSTH